MKLEQGLIEGRVDLEIKSVQLAHRLLNFRPRAEHHLSNRLAQKCQPVESNSSLATELKTYWIFVVAN